MNGNELLNGFSKAWIYTNRFTSHEGDKVQIKSVCLVRPGQDFITIFNGWQRHAGFNYTCDGTITMQEVLELPNLPDRLSLLSKLEMIGDEVPYITHEYDFKYL